MWRGQQFFTHILKVQSKVLLSYQKVGVTLISCNFKALSDPVIERPREWVLTLDATDGDLIVPPLIIRSSEVMGPTDLGFCRRFIFPNIDDRAVDAGMGAGKGVIGGVFVFVQDMEREMLLVEDFGV
jgi:hypothetical protein